MRKHSFTVLFRFAQNDKSDDEAMQVVLNKKYATRVVDMIEERISGDF